MNWKLAKLKKNLHLNTYMYNSCNTLNNTQGGQSMMLFLVAEFHGITNLHYILFYRGRIILWYYAPRNSIIDRPPCRSLLHWNIYVLKVRIVFPLSNCQFSIFVAIVFNRKKLDGMINDSSVFLWSLSKGTLEWYYSWNKITTTWIQIFRQNWSIFFSYVCHPIMI